jgi:ubiquinone/menaquinone biosynthesis C-methylase UbiE
MPNFTDPTYLCTDQYRDAANLNARIALHQRFSTNPQGWFPWVWETLAQLPRQASVLELGCGAGSLWIACPERIPAGWSLILSDFSPGMLDAAWRNLVVLGRGFKFEQIDAQAIPYADETFDLVIANHLLYHIPDRPKALGEIRRVLRPGGQLVATTVGEKHLQELEVWFHRLGADMSLSAGTNPFTLENGLGQLQPFFGQVETRRYADSLRITEIEPLLAYLGSSLRLDQPVADETLRVELEAELHARGELFVTKDSGLFLAVKSGPPFYEISSANSE